MERQIGERFCLDWNTDRLFGYEEGQSFLIIKAIEAGILAGVSIPAVPVVERKNSIYEIQYGADPDKDLEVAWDGGHHRARAYFNLWRPLPCISCRHFEDPMGRIRILIGSFRIDYKIPAIEELKVSLAHLSKDVAEKFCRDNGLDAGRFLSQ